MVHALLLQLPADEGAPQAIAAIVKAPGNRWLGDAVTRRDFCFDFSELPKSDPMKGPEEGKAENTDTSVETAAVADDDMSTASAARATEVADALAGVGSGQALLQLLRGYGVKKLPTRLDAAELARPPPPTGGGAAAAEAAAAAAARRATAQRAGLPQQPELPPPWAEGPPRDKTQVGCFGGLSYQGHFVHGGLFVQVHLAPKARLGGRCIEDYTLASVTPPVSRDKLDALMPLTLLLRTSPPPHLPHVHLARSSL